jgi:septal ring factor EnvC (AmiA/AmiB activator)
MDAIQIYEELSKQLESISGRLLKIEEKIDLQAEKDHHHDLTIQRMGLEMENIVKEITELKISSQLQGKDLKNMGERIKNLEDQPDKKKAGIINKILDRSFNYIISIILAGIAAYIAVNIFNK